MFSGYPYLAAKYALFSVGCAGFHVPSRYRFSMCYVLTYTPHKTCIHSVGYFDTFEGQSIRGLRIHVLLITGLRLGSHKQQDMRMIFRHELRASCKESCLYTKRYLLSHTDGTPSQQIYSNSVVGRQACLVFSLFTVVLNRLHCTLAAQKNGLFSNLTDYSTSKV